MRIAGCASTSLRNPGPTYPAAAVPELNGRVKQLQGEMKRRDAENAALRRRLEKLELLLARATK